MLSFYHEIFKAQCPNKIPYKSEREMKTLASALDAILECSLDRAGDTQLGRYKALEDATLSGSWEVAQEYDAVPQRDNTIVSDAERQRAVSMQVRRVRFDAALTSVRGGWRAAGALADNPG